MAESFQHHFEWDPAKARLNLRKHGISFERATAVFHDPRALSLFDEEHNEYEDRWVTLGLDLTGTLLVVCHTYHATAEDRATIRLISARKATAKEASQYRET